MQPVRTFAGLIAVGLLLATAAVPAGAAGAIRAGSITNSPPMISYASDGTTLQGAIVDLAAAMSSEMHRKITFEAIPFKGLLPAMEAKRIDIVFSLMNDTPQREKIIDFVDFFDLSTMLLIRKGNPQQVESLETLCGKTVSTVQGSTQIALVNAASAKCTAAGKGSIQNLQYSQPSDARLQVQSGHVAAFLGNSPVMVYLAKTAGEGKIFDVVPGHVYQPVPLGIGVAKSNTRLRDELQKSLNALIANGTYRKILEKYGIESGAVGSATINGGANLKL
jgi:polar amino acid transport system substrate-binding protein